MLAAPVTRVIIASKNPVKINAVRAAFLKALPHLQLQFVGAPSSSGVPDQPWGDEQTLRGALNRVAGLAGSPEHASDVIVALEGGVGPAFAIDHPLSACSSSSGGSSASGGSGAENVPPNTTAGGAGQQQQLEVFAWAAIRAPSGAVSHARSASFTLPPAVAELVHAGWELGAADDAVFQRTNSGQGSGTIGRLTMVASGGEAEQQQQQQQLITRRDYYEHCCICALVPLINPELFPGFELPPQQAAAP